MIVLSLLFVCSIAAGVSASDNATDILTLSKGGVVMSYPSDWGSSEATSNYSIMSISKLDSIDSAGIGQVNINVEKKPLEGSFSSFVEGIYKSMKHDSSFTLVSSGDVVVGDKNAVEYIYTSNNNGVEREHKAVWFEKGDQAYVVMYSAPINQFEENLYIFDYVLSELQIA